MNEVGEWLGIGLVNLVNIFNPEVIVVGGNLRGLLPLVDGIVQDRIRSALPAAREQVRVTLPATRRRQHADRSGGDRLRRAADRIPSTFSRDRTMPSPPETARRAEVVLAVGDVQLAIDLDAGARATRWTVGPHGLLSSARPPSLRVRHVPDGTVGGTPP